MDFTQENFEMLQADLLTANEKITTLETDLENAKTIISGLADENQSLKNEVDRLINTPDKEEKATGVGSQFEAVVTDDDGNTVTKMFRIMCSQMTIPRIGKLTALEILTNEEAKEWLVKNKSEMIKEVY